MFCIKLVGLLLVLCKNFEVCEVVGYYILVNIIVFVNCIFLMCDFSFWDFLDEFNLDCFIDLKVIVLGLDFNYFLFGYGKWICFGFNFGMIMV